MVSFLTATTSRFIAATVNISVLRGQIKMIEQNYKCKRRYPVNSVLAKREKYLHILCKVLRQISYLWKPCAL
jgi:hypothetical protein